MKNHKPDGKTIWSCHSHETYRTILINIIKLIFPLILLMY